MGTLSSRHLSFSPDLPIRLHFCSIIHAYQSMPSASCSPLPAFSSTTYLNLAFFSFPLYETPVLTLLRSSRVYCSDECESLDSASPSLSSATSSVHPSPSVTSMKSSNLDIPALVPSMLGHRPRYSISSSSASSTAWSSVTTDDDEDPYVYTEQIDMLADGSKSPGYQSGLVYARRPSATNHRSTMPTVHRHASAVSSSASSCVISRGLPSPFYASTEDDASSVCISELSLHDDDASARRKAKRTSLPAYFSLLQGSSVKSSSAMTASSPRRTPSTLHAISRSLHASPTTPTVSHATVVLTNAEAHIESTTTTNPISRGRGRRRERESDIRSSSSRRSTARSPPRHLSAAQRARVDSIEKVAEWVSSSPVIALAPGRRNSSPQRKPKYEFVEELTRGLRDCALASSSSEGDDSEAKTDFSREDVDRTIRGRRRMDELDEVLRGGAPGYGNGRSGLRARERGRGLASRTIGIALR